MFLKVTHRLSGRTNSLQKCMGVCNQVVAEYSLNVNCYPTPCRPLYVYNEEQQQSYPKGSSPRTLVPTVGLRLHHDLLVRVTLQPGYFSEVSNDLFKMTLHHSLNYSICRFTFILNFCMAPFPLSPSLFLFPLPINSPLSALLSPISQWLTMRRYASESVMF